MWYDLGGNEQYRGRDWGQIEDSARREWERSHPKTAAQFIRCCHLGAVILGLGAGG